MDAITKIYRNMGLKGDPGLHFKMSQKQKNGSISQSRNTPVLLKEDGG
jgi:hypothetical protein